MIRVRNILQWNPPFTSEKSHEVSRKCSHLKLLPEFQSCNQVAVDVQSKPDVRTCSGLEKCILKRGVSFYPGSYLLHVVGNKSTFTLVCLLSESDCTLFFDHYVIFSRLNMLQIPSLGDANYCAGLIYK